VSKFLKNRKHLTRIAGFGFALFVVIGLFFINHLIAPVQSQTPGTTPTSLKLTLNSVEVSQTGKAYSLVSDKQQVLDVIKNNSTPFGTVASGISTGGNLATTLNDTKQAFTPNQFQNSYQVEITGGVGAGQTATIIANSATQLTVSPSWTTIPDNTSKYQIRSTNDNPFGDFELPSGTYKGLRITLADTGTYSGTDPCTGLPATDAPIKLPGGSNEVVILTYTTEDVTGRASSDLLLHPITIGSADVELRLVFPASNSVTCLPDGITVQIESPPVLVSSSDAQALLPQYFYSGEIDKSQLTNPIICSSSSETCQVTGTTSTAPANGNFIWELNSTTPPLPFSNTTIVGDAFLSPPDIVTLTTEAGGGQVTRLNLGCNTLINLQGPPLVLFTMSSETGCPSLSQPDLVPQIAAPIPAVDGKYIIPYQINTQTPQDAISNFEFTSTPLTASQFPQPVLTITVKNTATDNPPSFKYPIRKIAWSWSAANPNPIILSQRVQISVNLPCVPGTGGTPPCNVTRLDPCYTAAGGITNAALIFDSGSLDPSVTSFDNTDDDDTNNVENNNCDINLSDVKRIHFLINDALGTNFNFNLNSIAPDLIETTISDNLSPQRTASRGSSFQITDTAENSGTADSGVSTTTQYYLSLDGDNFKSSADRLLTGNRTVPALPPAPGPGNTSTGTVTVTIPSSTPVGIYFLLACADDTDAVLESNEQNNCIASSSPVTIGPDLVETTISDPPATRSRGGSFSATDTVQNQGGENAGSSTTQYYLSSVTSGIPFKLTGSRTVPTPPATVLVPGAMDSATTTVTIPFSVPLGAYFLEVCADDTNHVLESDETNNCKVSTGKIQVNQ